MDEDRRRARTLDIAGLHARHALNKELTDVFAAAATVTMHRHHRSPTTWVVRIDDENAVQYEVSWYTPTDGDLRSYGHDDETTELGACALALAAVEAHLGLIAYARARPRSGVDFYLLAPPADSSVPMTFDVDGQASLGLEVSGISHDDTATMQQRLRDKVEQVRRGNSPDWSLAGVVGFRTARVVFRTAKP